MLRKLWNVFRSEECGESPRSEVESVWYFHLRPCDCAADVEELNGREAEISERGRRAEIVDADALETAVEESVARVVTGGGQLVQAKDGLLELWRQK